MIISGEKEGKLLFYSSILWFFFLIVSTCALIYLNEFYEPCCEGAILQRISVIVQGAPNLGSHQINFQGWMFLIPPVWWEFKVVWLEGNLQLWILSGGFSFYKQVPELWQMCQTIAFREWIIFSFSDTETVGLH